MKNLTQLSFDPPLLFHSFFLPFIPTTFFFFLSIRLTRFHAPIN